MLYILALKDKTAFKVGVTNRHDLMRIAILARKYKFDLNKSYVITTKINKTSQVLEKQLHSDYNKFKFEFENKLDGHSEFIKYEQLKNILRDIKYKARLEHLGIKIFKYEDYMDATLISDKIKLGLKNSRCKGRFGGRPRTDITIVEKIREMVKNGVNKVAIAKELGISRGTIYEYIKQVEN